MSDLNQQNNVHHAPFRKIRLQQTQIGFPLVSNDLATSETSNRDDHFADVDDFVKEDCKRFCLYPIALDASTIKRANQEAESGSTSSAQRKKTGFNAKLW
jgi:hypothetical protein